MNTMLIAGMTTININKKAVMIKSFSLDATAPFGSNMTNLEQLLFKITAIQMITS
jgi:hypothetical protein